MSGFKVNFSVNNQLATPSIHAAPFAQRPAFGQPGRVFIDTDSPSTGIYRDTGTAWIQIASTSSPEADTLQTVTDRGNTTTQSVTIGSIDPPAYPLDVYGDTDIINVHATNGNDGVILFSKAGSHRWRAGNYHGGGNDHFSIYNMQENSDAILVSLSTNNVAIGGHTTAPTYRLDIAGSLANTGAAYLGTSGGSSAFGTTTPDTTSVLTIQRGAKTENLWLTSSDGTNSIEFSSDSGTIRTGIQADSSGLGFGGGASFRSALFIGRTTNRTLVNTTTDNGSTLRVNGNVNPNFLTFRSGGYIEFYTVADNDARGNTQRVVTGNIYRNISFGGAEYGAVSGIIKFGYFDVNTATFTSRGELSSTSWVFNELAANVDFRIESQTNANLFFVDASVDNIGIGTNSPNSNALLDITSTTKGVKFPSMTTAQKSAIANTAGLVVFDTDLAKLCVNSGAGWETITSV